MSKLSARLADFLRASAALLESAFLGLGLPQRSVVMPEPNSCCHCLITVVSADSHADDLISGTWCQNHPSHWSPSPLSMLQFRSLNNLHNLVVTSCDGNGNPCFHICNLHQLTICSTSFLVMIPATKMGDLSKSSERSEILLPNPGIFEHVCISGWSNPLGTWKLIACIIPKRIEVDVYVRPPSNYIQYR